MTLVRRKSSVDSNTSISLINLFMMPRHLHRTLYRRWSDDLFSVIGVLFETWL